MALVGVLTGVEVKCRLGVGRVEKVEIHSGFQQVEAKVTSIFGAQAKYQAIPPYCSTIILFLLVCRRWCFS